MTVSLEAAKLRGLSQEGVIELSRLKGEPDWMREKRLLAWRAFEATREQLGEPLRPQWRNIETNDLRMESIIPFQASADGLEALPKELRSAIHGNGRAGLLLQRDSTAVYQALGEEWLKRGVIFTDLDSALREHGELLKEYLMTRCLAVTEGRSASLHAAFWSGGTLLYVPAGVQVTLPFHAYFWLDTPGLGLFVHNLIIVGAGGKVTFLEEFHSSPSQEQALHSGAVEIFVGEEAEVRFASLEYWGENVFNFGVKRAIVERDSSMRWVTVPLGGGLNKATLETILRGPGAGTDTTGIFFADQRQRLNLTSVTTHEAPHTTGDILFKGAVKDKARSVFQGLIRVKQAARQTNSYLADHTLQLSEEASSESIPGLEIETNDVRCSHGASVGEIDEEQLFYLMSRGLSRGDSERLIVNGFFEPIIQRIPLEEVQEKLRHSLEGKMLHDTEQ